MSAINQLQEEIRKKFPPGEDRKWPAMLGNAAGEIDAGDGLVYVLANGQTLTLPGPNIPHVVMPVLIGYSSDYPNVLRVLDGWDVFATPAIPLMMYDHENFEYPAWNTLWVNIAQIQWLNCLPDTLFNVKITGGVVLFNGAYVTIDNQSIDVEASVPATGALYILLQCDDSGIVTPKDGTPVGAKELLTNADIPAVDSGFFPLCAVALYEGQTKLQRVKSVNDFVDLRFTSATSTGVEVMLDTSNFSGFLSSSDDDIQEVADNYDDHIHSSAELLGILDPYYPRKWLKSGAPTVNDDITGGYAKSDIWIDQSNGDAYICINNAQGAAVWWPVGSGSGDYTFAVDGRLAVATNIPNAFIVTKDVEIEACYIYCKDPGTASSTIVDINKNGTTIYTTQANRPTLAWDDANGWASSIPDILTFVAGDVITLDIDQIGTLVADLVVALSVKSASGGGNGSGLTVTDGVTTVDNVGKITLDGFVTDDGGGEITVLPGIVVQIVQTETGAMSSGTTIIPLDNTIPQQTEGDEYMTHPFTPLGATDLLYIKANLFFTAPADRWITMALFQDSDNDALAAIAELVHLATAGVTVNFEHKMVAGTTSTITFKLKAGLHAAGTLYFNGQNGSQLFGGVMCSSLKITEVLA